MDRCTFCGSDASDRAFIARAPSSSAAICGSCLAVAFRALEYKKGLLPSPGVARLIGASSMWPGERRLRQFNHAYARFTQRRNRPRPAAAPVSVMYEPHVHPLAQFEKRCAMCARREMLIPTPKGARICEPCVESWTRTLLG